jgi:hypothetical protein
METNLIPIDCACVIHGDAYSWTYVERLHSMLRRNLSRPVVMHVWTEASRPCPAPYVKHNLVEWPGIAGPKKAWWYKLQMFNSKEFRGKLLYFDLDVVITGNLDWIINLDPSIFWCIRDFRYLWRPNWQGINSSIMYWDTLRFKGVWKHFSLQNIATISRKYAGDQDYITEVIRPQDRRFFDQNLIKSWRWQVLDGGMNMRTKIYNQPGTGATVDNTTKVIIFHGQPKPDSVQDPYIQTHWC